MRATLIGAQHLPGEVLPRHRACERAAAIRRGLADDRHWMLVRPNGRFVTQRELPRMALIGTAVDGGAR